MEKEEKNHIPHLFALSISHSSFRLSYYFPYKMSHSDYGIQFARTKKKMNKKKLYNIYTHKT